MAGGQCLGAQLARRIHQIGELHFLVAAHAGDRRLAARIGIGEILDHVLAEAAFVIQHIMRNADGFGDAFGVVDILPGTAGAFFLLHRVRIELQGDADHVIALTLEQRGGDGGIHAARHGGDNTAFPVAGAAVAVMAGCHIGAAPRPEPQGKPVLAARAVRNWQIIQQHSLLRLDVTCSAACKAVWFKDNWVAASAMLVFWILVMKP